MLASDQRHLLRRLCISGTLTCLSLTQWTPGALAQRRYTPGERRYARPDRPLSRPALGNGGGSITRPAPGFDRGNRRPAGGWVNTVPPMRPRPIPGGLSRPTRPIQPLPPGLNRPSLSRPDLARPGLTRPGLTRPGITRPDVIRPSWSRPGWNRPNWIINRPVNITAINTRPRWWGSSWATNRPWRYGWYSGNPGGWGWWRGSSVAWGITSLASAAIIASAIKNAVRSNQSTIDVNDSPYQLVYGSVQAIGDHDATFSFLFEGSAYQATANCKNGLLNNRSPDNPEEAQLLNAACQVAYASF